MKFLKFIDHPNEEVGFCAYDESAKFGIILTGPPNDRTIKYMEGGSSKPVFEVKQIERIFAFGGETGLSWDLMWADLFDEEIGATADASKASVWPYFLKKRRSVITNIFKVEK